MQANWLKSLSAEQPVLIAGPTASGKSAMALEIATSQGGIIVNADALQIYDNWRILTARPSRDEEAAAEHALYGHVARDADYSVGHWLRDVQRLLGGERVVIVGGTGLYFMALTQGLADIPPVPMLVRQEADELDLGSMLEDLDPETCRRIDTLNRARVQRAWEVQSATGRGLASWQDATPAPLLPLNTVAAFVLEADRDWLAARIERRFDSMIANGALEEARANLDGWDPARASAKAIGAPELIDHLQGNRDLKDAVAEGKVATRQYAKRQRTWFRSKMARWQSILLP